MTLSREQIRKRLGQKLNEAYAIEHSSAYGNEPEYITLIFQ